MSKALENFFSVKKAQAFVWLAILIVILIMGVFYIMLSEPMTKIRDKFGGNFTDSIYEAPYQKITTIWDKFLVIFLLSILSFGVLTAMRKKDYEY